MCFYSFRDTFCVYNTKNGITKNVDSSAFRFSSYSVVVFGNREHIHNLWSNFFDNMTEVINLKYEEYDVYIGRGSKWQKSIQNWS